MTKIYKIHIFQYNDNSHPYLWVAKYSDFFSFKLGADRNYFGCLGLYEIQVKNFRRYSNGFYCGDYVEGSGSYIKPDQYKKMKNFIPPLCTAMMKSDTSDLRVLQEYFN